MKGAKWKERYCVLTAGAGGNSLQFFDIRGAAQAAKDCFNWRDYW